MKNDPLADREERPTFLCGGMGWTTNDRDEWVPCPACQPERYAAHAAGRRMRRDEGAYHPPCLPTPDERVPFSAVADRMAAWIAEGQAQHLASGSTEARARKLWWVTEGHKRTPGGLHTPRGTLTPPPGEAPEEGGGSDGGSS